MAFPFVVVIVVVVVVKAIGVIGLVVVVVALLVVVVVVAAVVVTLKMNREYHKMNSGSASMGLLFSAICIGTVNGIHRHL